jgi:hypothetical protein
MIAMEEKLELDVRSGHEGELQLEPADISFEDLTADRVRIRVTVHNAGARRSRPTTMRLESAPLGAFVPWQPLTVLSVPRLEPGESRELAVDVTRPHPAPLGEFGRVPPKRVLTAVNAPDQPAPRRGGGFMAVLELLRRGQPAQPASGSVEAREAALAPDLWDLLGRGQPHWAGNINVFIGNRAVERHVAKALRVYPGRTNIAMFVVGSAGRRDAYAFELVGLGSDWKGALYNMTNSQTLLVDSSDGAIQETHWVESAGGLMVMLATRPPAGCRTGEVEVHVTRRSCGTTALVEFNLDPAAQGPGCYSL